jgi:hypothetical protein
LGVSTQPVALLWDIRDQRDKQEGKKKSKIFVFDKLMGDKII